MIKVYPETVSLHSVYLEKLALRVENHEDDLESSAPVIHREDAGLRLRLIALQEPAQSMSRGVRGLTSSETAQRCTLAVNMEGGKCVTATQRDRDVHRRDRQQFLQKGP